MAEKLKPATAPKHAMVLAAGLGTRMRSFNGRVPKPLVAVGGKALIDYALDRLAAQGVERTVVNVHHLADQIERHLAGRKRPKIIISDERGELLGTGGGVVKALPKLGDGPFFHVNSDTIWIDGVRPNLARLADAFEPERMDALLLLATTASSIGYTGRGDFSMPAPRSSPRLSSPARPRARSACRRCSTGRRKPAGSAGCGWKACGCTSARPRRSPPPKRRSSPARRSRRSSPRA